MKTGSVVIALLGLLGIVGLSPAAQAETAEEIVGKALAARGGLEKIRSVQTECVFGNISLGPGADGPFSVELKRPGKMHAEFTLQGQTLIRTYDGKSGWVLNPFTGSTEAQPMSAEDIHSIADESDFDGPLVDYQSKGGHIEFVRKEELEGKSVLRLKLTQKNGDVRFYLFDATSFELYKGETTRTIEGQAYPVETFFSDYRDVDGLKFAYRIQSRSRGQDQQQNITIDKIELNTAIDDSRFGKPAPAAPAAAPTAVPAPAPSAPGHGRETYCDGGRSLARARSQQQRKQEMEA
ncbi:MAG TPA: hypothetical protein VK525_11345 [Candidatus Saccharimonadales bacterium]|nr:hypothetical protein [Candidatus Saccharimonadales bacterium]